MSRRVPRAPSVQPLPPVVAPSIDPQCQAIGRPSPDNQIRVYTQEECEGGMKGLWYPNGECLKKEGGSWSAICAPLNFAVTTGPPGATPMMPPGMPMPMPMPAPGMPMPAPGMPMPMPAPGMPMPMPAPGMPMPMPAPGTPMMPPGMMVNPEQVERMAKVKNAAQSLREILDLTSGKIERLRQVMNSAMTGGKRRSTKKAKKARKAKSSRRQKRTSK